MKKIKKTTLKPVVVLLSDFGVTDNYVGVMKGVLMSALPGIQVVDMTHGIPPQDIRAAAFQLLTGYKEFPKKSLFLCVVDPGVGSDRTIIFAETKDYGFMAPDNGLLSWVLEKEKPSHVWAIKPSASPRSQVSHTFHGRDIFAPVAVRLLRREKLPMLGRAVKSWVKIPFSKLEKSGSQWKAEIIYIDGFGNLITNIPNEDLAPYMESSKVWFEFGTPPRSIRGLVRAYAEADSGGLLAIQGSHGFIEISVRNGNARALTGLSVGSKVEVYFRV